MTTTRVSEAALLYMQARRALRSSPPRWREFFDCLRRAAELGYPRAQSDLGEWYLEGFKQGSRTVLLPRSPRRGRALLQSAAKAGVSDAFFPLGVCFDLGEGGEKSKRSALYWYRRAARRGHPSAAFNAATVYRDLGQRSGQMRWLRRAIELGDDDAVIEFGRLVLSARASETVRRAAVRHLRKLATRAAPKQQEAMALLAHAYEVGAGVTASPNQAEGWRRKAARSV